MQQGSQSRRKSKYNNLTRRFFLLAGLSLISLVTVISITVGHVRATEVNTIPLSTPSIWQGGSFPVENFQAYTSGFGYRRSPRGGSGTEFHRGLDMAAPDGSYIRNWWMGQVVEVSDNTLCGTSVKIQSGNWTHVYCHMKGHVEKSSSGRYIIDRSGGIQIWEGQQLPTGVRIGRVGMTGRTTGPHLHWGLKYGSEYIDPARVLRAMYTQQAGTGSVANHSNQRD